MRFWTDEETGARYCEPDCVEEWLYYIWTIGHDYDGYNDAENLKEIIDELVYMSQRAQDCLHDGKLFSEEEKKEEN